MGVTKRTDARLRRRLRAELERAERVLCGAEFELDRPWRPLPGSAAAAEVSITLPLVQRSGLPVDVAPVLQWSRTFAADAARRIVALGRIVVAAPSVRAAELDPVARSAAESGLWARWLLDTADPRVRLARALLADLEGARSHVGYFTRIGHRDLGDAETYVTALVGEIDRLFGSDVARNAGGRVIGVLGERLPKATDLFRTYLRDAVPQATGSGVYGELSVQAHPVAHADLWRASDHSFDHGQIVGRYGRDLHDEGRILNPATVGFAFAASSVRDLFGAPSDDVLTWAYGISDLLNEWCDANGCRAAP